VAYLSFVFGSLPRRHRRHRRPSLVRCPYKIRLYQLSKLLSVHVSWGGGSVPLARCVPSAQKKKSRPRLSPPRTTCLRRAPASSSRRVRHGGEGIFPARHEPTRNHLLHLTHIPPQNSGWATCSQRPGARAAACHATAAGRRAVHGSVAHIACSCELDACHHGMSRKDELFTGLTHAPARAGGIAYRTAAARR